jgi:hypothetical protein
MTFDSLVRASDILLLMLISESNNASFDDSDGFWLIENTDWCNRYLYYKELNNKDLVEELCTKYSARLPDVKFYYIEDDVFEDSSVSEIGYIITH